MPVAIHRAGFAAVLRTFRPRQALAVRLRGVTLRDAVAKSQVKCAKLAVVDCILGTTTIGMDRPPGRDARALRRGGRPPQRGGACGKTSTAHFGIYRLAWCKKTFSSFPPLALR